MRKRRREEYHEEEEEQYSLPIPKAQKQAHSATFKPDIDEFCIIINEAIRFRLHGIIKTTLKNKPKSDVKDLKKTEDERTKTPRYTYDALDNQYGSYWTHHSLRRLKMNSVTTYTDYVKENFNDIVKEVKATLATEIKEHEQAEPNEHSSVDDVVEENVKSIVVPLGQVLRTDLPIVARRTIIDKFNNAIRQYSDFASVFAANVQLQMLKFVTFESNSVQINSIIPHEFQDSSIAAELPVAPNQHTNYDAKRKSDYNALFTLNHLQVISSLAFGVRGIQKVTHSNHPLWVELYSSGIPQTVQDGDINNDFQQFIEEAKNINATIKKSTVAQFSTNLETMYKGSKRFKSALDKILKVLLKINLQRRKERERRDYKDSKKNISRDDTNTTVSRILTRNKKRSLLNRYKKKLKKHEENNQADSANRMKKSHRSYEETKDE